MLFDREMQDSYKINITCTDAGDPPLSDIQSLDIRITDENDNDPEIPSRITAEITENNDVGVVIVQLNSTDRDEGQNSKLLFELDDPTVSGKLITLNPTTGIVTASVAFDYEIKQQYVFRIVVRDRGYPPRSGTTDLVLDVGDLNDEVPAFAKTAYYFNVFENRPGGTSVGRIDAKDADRNRAYNTISYSIRETDQPFSMDEDSGQIRTLRTLDREDRSLYRLTAVAADSESPTHEATTNVFVYVTDENDNRPRILHHTDTSPSILCNIQPGNVITRVEALDPDEGQNGQLAYSIIGGNEARIFAVHRRTGIITVSETPTGDNCKLHTVTIEVRDGGEPSLVSTTDVVINLNNVTGGNPNLLPAGYAASELRAESSTAESGGVNWGMIIPGIIAGTVAIVVVIVGAALAVYFVRRRRHRQQIRKSREKRELKNEEPDGERIVTIYLSAKDLRRLSARDLRTGRFRDDMLSSCDQIETVSSSTSSFNNLNKSVRTRSNPKFKVSITDISVHILSSLLDTLKKLESGHQTCYIPAALSLIDGFLSEFL